MGRVGHPARSLFIDDCMHESDPEALRFMVDWRDAGCGGIDWDGWSGMRDGLAGSSRTVGSIPTVALEETGSNPGSAKAIDLASIPPSR